MAKKKAVAKTPTFEQSLEQLEEIVAKLEGGDLPLSESLEQYEQGTQHLKACHKMLSQAERRIELVAGVDASGQPRTEPFCDADDVENESLTTKGASRSRRRSTKTRSKPQDEVDDSSSLF